MKCIGTFGFVALSLTLAACSAQQTPPPPLTLVTKAAPSPEPEPAPLTGAQILAQPPQEVREAVKQHREYILYAIRGSFSLISDSVERSADLRPSVRLCTRCYPQGEAHAGLDSDLWVTSNCKQIFCNESDLNKLPHSSVFTTQLEVIHKY
jgi:hypothetical protein